jgi:hypothetical protein
MTISHHQYDILAESANAGDGGNGHVNTDDVGLPPGTVFGVAVGASVKVSGTRSLTGVFHNLLRCFIFGGQHFWTSLVSFAVGSADGRRICSDIF